MIEHPPGIIRDGRKRPIFIHSSVDDAQLSAAEFRVYCHLSRRADGEDRAYPGIPSIARICKLEDKTVRSALKELHRRGFIRVIEKPGKANDYLLTDCHEWLMDPSQTAPLPNGTRGAEWQGHPSQTAPYEGTPLKVLQSPLPPEGENGEGEEVPPEELFSRLAKAHRLEPREANTLRGSENARTLVNLGIRYRLLEALEKLWAIPNGKEFKGRKVYHVTKLFKFCQEPTGDIGTARELFLPRRPKPKESSEVLTLAPAPLSEAELDAAHALRYREKVRAGLIIGIAKACADAPDLPIPARVKPVESSQPPVGGLDPE